MPAERIPAFAGQSRPPVAVFASTSIAKAATGTETSTSVFQSTRHQVAVGSAPTAIRNRSAPFAAWFAAGYL